MTETCPYCQTQNVGPGTTELKRTIGDVTFEGEVEVDRCADCGEWFLSFEEGQRFDFAVARALAEYGIGTPDAFKRMRKTVGLRAMDLARLIGVTPETVSRWETGKVPVERRALALLQSLVVEHTEGSTATLERLRVLADQERRPPRSVRIAL